MATMSNINEVAFELGFDNKIGVKLKQFYHFSLLILSLATLDKRWTGNKDDIISMVCYTLLYPLLYRVSKKYFLVKFKFRGLLYEFLFAVCYKSVRFVA